MDIPTTAVMPLATVADRPMAVRDQAPADKMKPTPAPTARACKLGERM